MANILAVDDEKNVVDLMRTTLELAGHQVRDAGNGAKALEVLGIEPPNEGVDLPDIIVLDIAMPILDGYTVAVRLQENANTRSIPIVVVSVKGQMRENFQLLPNVKGFIEKPFDTEYLAKLVGTLTKKV